MTTLILTDADTLARHNLGPILGNRPGFVVVETVACTEDACTQILAHQPDVIVIAGSPPDSEMCSVVTRVATMETHTRVVYVSTYEDSPEQVAPQFPGVCAILTRENSFEDLFSTMLVVLHGGLFLPPPPPRQAPDPAGQAKAHGLSRREHEVLKGIFSGQTTKTIARAMSLSPKTVETYRSRLMRKLGLHCATELVQFAMKNHLD